MAAHDVAYFREQGQSLGAVMVHWADVQSREKQAMLDYVRLHANNAGLVGKTAICWMSGSRPQYFGPPDLVRFLVRIPYNRLPWNCRLTIS